MNWEWPYVIALLGALIPGALGLLSWMNERRKGNVDLMTVSQSSAVQLLQAAQVRLKDVEEDLQTIDLQYDAEKAKRREYEDTLAEERRLIRNYLSKIKELETVIGSLETQVKDLKEKLSGLELREGGPE